MLWLAGVDQSECCLCGHINSHGKYWGCNSSFKYLQVMLVYKCHTHWWAYDTLAHIAESTVHTCSFTYGCRETMCIRTGALVSARPTMSHSILTLSCTQLSDWFIEGRPVLPTGVLGSSLGVLTNPRPWGQDKGVYHFKAREKKSNEISIPCL